MVGIKRRITKLNINFEYNLFLLYLYNETTLKCQITHRFFVFELFMILDFLLISFI